MIENFILLTISSLKKSNFIIIWNIAFFSLIPFVSSSITPFVDESYNSHEDLYDAILNTFFPIFFVILFNVSGETGPIKKVFLPLLDDLLYNMVTWVIPLIVSFAYDDLLGIKIFSLVNMVLHVTCAIVAIINNDIKNGGTLFKLTYFIAPVLFYAPNILQTLLIVLNWPINFYFVKACIFILVLSLTRNVSYFTDEVPDDFLATSTMITQQELVDLIRRNFGKNEKKREKEIKVNETIRQMQTSMNEMKETIDDLKKLVGLRKENEITEKEIV
ncbi:hypothetical protein GLOIN_2v1667018 [Rhizophagus clarus]|uniref:Uncharacterized protein n=1 Tax=Rhizophagus clarus TaxID=94130 RepID=A0A8H3LXE9_9GLOM|nr:hypothetical protein GLOIN_2v1667018 [Rhizophagus clarus]